MGLFLWAVLLGLLLVPPALGADQPPMEKVPVIKDVWVSAYPGELDTSMGKTTQLKLKGNAEVALLDFGTWQFAGPPWVAVRAELWMHDVPEAVEAEKKRLGVDPARPDCLRMIGLSTIPTPWEEGSQTETYKPDPVGATYRSAGGGRPWSYPGSQLWDVIFGNGNSLHCHAERQYQGNGWWKVEVDPRLVNMVMYGFSYGLAVEDESSPANEFMPNNYVHSHESGEFAPYLLVSLIGPAWDWPIHPPREVHVEPAPDRARLGHGAVRITFRDADEPHMVFGYSVEVNGTPLPLWQVPRPVSTGTQHEIVLDDLPGGGEVKVSVRSVRPGSAYDRGNVGTATGTASPAREVPPPLPASPFRPTPHDPQTNGRMTVWAFPEVTKVDPISGEAMFEPQRDMRRANAVWDGEQRCARIAAARGEIASFQIAVETAGEPLRNVQVDFSDLRGNFGGISAYAVHPYRMWYVPAGGKWQEEYAIPLRGAFDIPAADNAVPGQRVQAVYVDVVVPPDAPALTYRGMAVIRADGVDPLPLNVEVQVYPARIPAEVSFNAELNAYGPPGGEAGSEYFYAAHRLAHYNRCTINVLGYSQNGNVAKGYAPTLAGEGAEVHITDWSEFDRIMGPLLDGSAFRDNPRAGVPVKTFYLPLSEHWPLSFWKYYPFHGDPKQEKDMARRALEAPPIDQAFPADYRDGWRKVVRQFGEHLASKGWSHTDFQCYFNDKPDYGGTWWTLDEPMGRDDWLALRFWAGLFKEATADLHAPNLRFRGDISRPWWQYDMLEGRMDTIYYNSEIFDYAEFARRYNHHIPDPHVYGAANEIAESDHQTAAWCLKAYTLGLNGVLPWQSLGGMDALRKPDQTALIVPGDLAGYPGPVASLRLLALRRGAQDVELLRLLAQKNGWTNEQVGALIASRVPLGSAFSQQFQDEAAALGFGDLSAQGFAELKEGVLMMLVQ